MSTFISPISVTCPFGCSGTLQIVRRALRLSTESFRAVIHWHGHSGRMHAFTNTSRAWDQARTPRHAFLDPNSRLCELSAKLARKITKRLSLSASSLVKARPALPRDETAVSYCTECFSLGNPYVYTFLPVYCCTYRVMVD